jgi:hypothetical protein
VADQKWAINRMTDMIEGLSHEFQFDRRTTQTMNQQNSDPSPVEEDLKSRLLCWRCQTPSCYPRGRASASKSKHAQHTSREAALVKLADKIGNLRDVAANPSAHWSVERWTAYFAWATAVIDGLAQVSREPLGLFNAAYAAGPHGGERNGHGT